jgi:hypothetical protein
MRFRKDYVKCNKLGKEMGGEKVIKTTEPPRQQKQTKQKHAQIHQQNPLCCDSPHWQHSLSKAWRREAVSVRRDHFPSKTPSQPIAASSAVSRSGQRPFAHLTGSCQ